MASDPQPRQAVLISRDKAFAQTAVAAFQGAPDVELIVVEQSLKELEADFRRSAPGVVICDLEDTGPELLAALQQMVRRAGDAVPVIVITPSFDPEAARVFLKLKLSDFLVKPVPGADLARTVRRILDPGEDGEHTDAQIYTFMPAAGGVGTTTLVLQTAFILNEVARRKKQSVCVVDLNLQHGSCAEYLDLEPRFDIAEIENQPDRLDKQLLDVMLAKHKSGLSVISAPPCPWEMRSFRPDLVTRLLDLASTYFDHVVIDMPRTWFSWTDSILMGSDRLFVVTEMTVPTLRQTQRLIHAIQERVGKQAKPGVVVNRFDPKGAGGVREKDVIDVLGESYVGGIANNYRVVREALDRGVPIEEIARDCDVIRDLRRILLPEEKKPGARAPSLFAPALRLLGRRPALAAR
jgi:pilus assembly protein CpaE